MWVAICRSTINIVLYQRSLLFKKSKKTFSIISNDKNAELLIINCDSRNDSTVHELYNKKLISWSSCCIVWLQFLMAFKGLTSKAFIGLTWSID